MNKYIKIIPFIVMIALIGCEDFLEPVDENHRTLKDIYEDPYYAEGLLMNAYTRLPSNDYSFNDVATDDAVSNDKQNNYLRMATGEWSAIFNPVDQWNNSYTAIKYVNLFLGEIDDIEWSNMSEAANELFYSRHRGEAYALRALYMYHLLQAHGGYGPGGELLGVPIITEFIEGDDVDFSIPRATFDECVQQIFDDLDRAESYLPLDYGNIGDASALPGRYKDFTVEQFNRVFGDIASQRITRRIAMAIRAKTALLAASPAYNDGTTITMEDAANYTANVLDRIGGPSGLDPDGHLFFTGGNVDAVRPTAARDQAEMLWRTNRDGGSLWLEEDHFPPSMYGNGRINPTQNLVDAFPMANGYPIDHENSGYSDTVSYSERDPRLKNYIVVHGDSIAGNTILTETGSGNDAIDYLSTSTRTGYYMRKLLREDVSVDPTAQQPRRHYFPRIRYTELFLNYAEAANEAWGHDGTGGNDYSASDVISAIRERAGIEQPDTYLASITSKEEMRNLIRNERRLELCFEGHRFWDLRRWEEDLTEPAKSFRISGDNFEIVEQRRYDAHMYYPPIPYDEVLKFGLIQNNGW